MEQRDVVREGYDEIADAYDEQRSGDRPEEIEDGFGEAFFDDLSAGSRVLDAGCGGGRPVLETLGTDHDAVGLDISTSQLELARERVPDAGFARGDLAALPFADGAFDAVVSYYAVIHVPREEHAAVLSEFHRVLRPGGELLVSMGAIEGWEGRNDAWLDTDAAMEWSYFDPAKSRELVADAGFEIRDEYVPQEESEGFTFFRARS